MKTPPTTRRSLAAGLAAMALGAPPRAHASPPAAAPAERTVGFPAAPESFRDGVHSFYLQPWREMIRTRSFDALQDGLGIQNSGTGHASSLAMFRRHGFRHLRIGIGWASFRYDNPTLLNHDEAEATQSWLRAVRRSGLRPLVLLQAHDQRPCPFEQFQPGLARPAAAGDTTIELADASRLVPGRSGIIGFWVPVNHYVSLDPSGLFPASFVTAVDGGRVTLSRPLGRDLPPDASPVFVTLAYRPFGTPGSADYQATLAGWQTYVRATAALMTRALGTEGAPNLGFDLEIWNETSFGSRFLDINNYYPPGAGAGRDEYPGGTPRAMTDLVAATAAIAGAHPAAFAGVSLVNGFASVSPVPAAAAQPRRINALAKHPYPSVHHFPHDNVSPALLDARHARTAFVPAFSCYLHELNGTMTFPTAIVPDVADAVSQGGHGAGARPGDPCPVWITETGTAGHEVGVTEPAALWRLLAKGTLRALFFHLGIGVERVYLFRGVGDLAFFSIVDEQAPDTPTLPLLALARVLRAIAGATPEAAIHAPAAPRPFSYGIDHVGGEAMTLWRGDGGPGNPDFAQPDDFVLIPIAVTPRRTAFVYWLHGLDMRRDMAMVPVALSIRGFAATALTIEAYDPVADRPRVAKRRDAPPGVLRVALQADDVPAILVVTET